MGRFFDRWGVLAIVLLCLPAVPVAQEVPTSKEQSPQPAARPSPLERLITLRLRQVTLEVALREIERQSETKLLYSRTFVPLTREVSVEGKRISVGDALRLALQGTGIAVSMGADGAIVLEAPRREGRDSGKSRPGTLVGVVTDAKGGQGLGSAEVVLVGTQWGAKTDTAGRYRLVDVDSGDYKLMVRRVGYKQLVQQVTIHGTGRDTVNIALEPTVVALDELVTTATGKQRRREIPNAVTTINVDSVLRSAPIKSMSDLLEGRVPGLVTQRTSGAPGDPARHRLRGVGSALLSNDMVLVIDGQRIYDKQSRERSGNLTNLDPRRAQACPPTDPQGQPVQCSGNAIAVPAPSPLDQIDFNSIETIEVFKGPSATTIYGPDAASGVLVITTKRGKPGPAAWEASFARERTNQPGQWATGYYRWGHDAYLGVPRFCTLTDATCAPDSLVAFQALNERSLTLLDVGQGDALSLSVSGGNQALTYALTGSYNERIGTIRMPMFEVNRFRSQFDYSAPDWMQRPLVYQTWSVTNNVTARLSPTADVTLSSSLSRSEQQRTTLERQIAPTAATYVDTVNGRYYRPSSLPQGSSHVGGFGGSPESGYIVSADSVLYTDYFTRQTASAITFNTMITGNWRPRSWFYGTARAGLNVVSRNDELLLPSGLGRSTTHIGGTASQLSNGFVTHGTGRSLVGTFDIMGNLDKSVGRGFMFTTAFGFNLNTTATKDLVTSATNLRPGTSSIQGASNIQGNQLGDDVSIFGWYLEPRLRGQRISISMGLRVDGGSNYGTRITGGVGAPGGISAPKNPFTLKNLFGLKSLLALPKLGASWVVSEEPWFPLNTVFSSLRLRGAYGQSQQQPDVESRLRLYQLRDPFILRLPECVFNPDFTIVCTPTVNYPGSSDLRSLGNDRIQPERGTELEGGFDADLLDSRLSLGLTLYRKMTVDMLQARQLPPSVNGGGTVQFNIGNVRNTGLELELGLVPIQTPAITWVTKIFYTRNTNVVTKLGEGVASNPAQGLVAGYPLYSRWARPILGFADVNSDGVLQPYEIQVGDSLVFMGRLYPIHTSSFSTDLRLFNAVSISAMVSYDGGATQVNKLAQQFIFSRALVDPNVPLSEQAAALASTRATNRTDYGLIQDVSTVRFSSLSVSYRLPDRVAQLLRAREFSIAIQGSNLGLYSTYKGKDPNVNTWSPGEGIMDSGQLPTPRLWQISGKVRF